MYDCVFWDFHVSVPFEDFTMGVLRVLNVAPSQFHLNGWAIIHAFQALCLYTFVKTTWGNFFIILVHDCKRWQGGFSLLFLFTVEKDGKVGYFIIFVNC